MRRVISIVGSDQDFVSPGGSRGLEEATEDGIDGTQSGGVQCLWAFLSYLWDLEHIKSSWAKPVGLFTAELDFYEADLQEDFVSCL